MNSVRLKDLLITPVKNGYSPICVDDPTGKWVLGLGALDGSSINTREVKPVPIDNTKTNPYILEAGDFLVSRSNTSDKVGRAALYRGGLKNCSYPDLMMRFRVHEGKVFPDFLEEYLQSNIARRYFMRCAAGTSGSMVKITKSVVEKLAINLPSLEAQRSIAKLATSSNAVIKKTEALIAAKERQFGWLKSKLFSDASRENRLVPLSELVKFTDGYPFLSSEYSENGIYNILTIANVQFGSMAHSFKGKIFNIPEKVKRDQILELGDILISMTGNVGRVCKVDTPNCLLNQRVGKIRPNKDIHSDFLYFSLLNQKFLRKMIARAQGGAQGNISKKDILKYQVTLPFFEEQKRIAHTLNTAQQEIKLLKKQAAQYRTQKRGLMQKLLSGEWHITNKEIQDG